jgi:hypothetical protein
MSNKSLAVEDVLSMVGNLSDKHVLKGMPQQYVSDFAKAAVNVYSPRNIATILQHKFHIPNDRNYTEDAYLQSASELSVANYVKGKLVSDFESDKNVNESNQKDVDVYYRIGSTTACLEVKCPIEEEQAPFPKNITVQTAGRIAGHRQAVQNLRNA